MKDRSDLLSPAGFFVLRTPLLPFDDFAAWGAALYAPVEIAPQGLPRSLQSDREKLRAYLRQIVDRKAVREAIFLASPSLDDSISAWIRNPECDRGRKVERSLVKYFARMSGRATPHGLFAGISTGKQSNETVLNISARSEYRRRTRLDFHYLRTLTFNLFHDPRFCQDIVVRPNSSLHRTGNSLRFLALQQKGDERTFQFIVADSNNHVERVLALAASTAVTARQLVEAMVHEQPATHREDAEALIAQMLDLQLLVSELDPPLTGTDALADLLEQFKRHPSGGDLTRRFSKLRAALADADGSSLGLDLANGPAERYGAIAATLKDLPAPIDMGKLFHVDLFKPTAEATLGVEVLRELARGVTVLHRLGTRRDPWSGAEFRALFRQRYEENQEDVPLLELFDPELGLFGKGIVGSIEGTLLDDVNPKETEAAPPMIALKTDPHRLRLLGEALAAGTNEIILRDEDIALLSAPTPPPLPDSLAVQATLAARSLSDIRKGDFKLCIFGISGPSGGNLLGRFCYGDKPLEDGVRSLLAAEEALHPDAVYAEVVHLPSTERMGNFLRRPQLRRYEIPYLGRSLASPEYQIPVSDLTVSVTETRIVLRSRSLGKEVLPRLTTAHNFEDSSNDKLYQFLCSLQCQGVASWLKWDWGVLELAPFLPRVVYGKLILSLATWNLSKPEITTLAKASDEELFVAVQALRTRRKLPRFVLFGESRATDNWLPIDLDNILSIEAWVQLLGSRDQCVLIEMFPSSDELFAEGPEGRFVHELLVPFTVNRPPSAAPDSQTLNQTQKTIRTFDLGSEWLFAKVYLTGTAADELLIDLGPAFERLIKASAMDRFFFIRYGDPFWHLRIRIHGDPRRLQQEVLPALREASQRLVGDGVVWRFQLDSYRREIERYGGDAGIALCERIFCADSESILAILRDLTGEESPDFRWQLALPGLDRLLDDLGLSLDQRLVTLESMASSFRREFTSTPNLERSLGRKYRALATRIDELLHPSVESEPLSTSLRHFQRRSQTIKPLGDALRRHEVQSELRRPLTDIAGSLLHMHVNRLLRAHHRQHELVLYDLLLRHYRSAGKRHKK